MKIEPIDESALIINATGIGTVTRAMVHTRSVELAIINGRSAGQVSKSDWEQQSSLPLSKTRRARDRREDWSFHDVRSNHGPRQGRRADTA